MKHAERRDLPLQGPNAPARPIGAALQWILSGPLCGLFRVRVHGLENLPAGAGIISGNHVSLFDGILLFAIERKYRLTIRLIAKAELYDVKLFAWALDHLGCIPVKRGTADRAMITQASKALIAGEKLSVFPEGHRIRKGEDERAVDPDALGEAHGGAAYLALRTASPLIPTGIAGTERIKPPGQRLPHLPCVDIVFGQPIDPVALADSDPAFAALARKEKITQLTEMLMERIQVESRRARDINARRRGYTLVD
ncbi:MAG: 1-acyl-sn-glycerol-3-phosphate acyltransferase [Actinomycetes bacterium]|jgi:1-acyl-sn-glycerol-3-phosphate acyltransferase|nr:1-acyl-sn-glycerol-3-phosphate acyltransferase [Actinomycetes bacterium]